MNSEQIHPNEPILEALVMTTKQGSDEIVNALETLAFQQEKNNLEPIQEAQLITLDKIFRTLEEGNKKEEKVEEPEIVADEVTFTLKGLQGKPGKDADEKAVEERVFSRVTPLIPTKEEIISEVTPIIPTYQEVIEGIKPFIPAPIEGKQGKPGKQGNKGKDAEPIDVNLVISSVLEKIPTPKNGKPGKPGKDYDAARAREIEEKLDFAIRKTNDISSKTYSLIELDDVSITNPTDGQGLVYSSSLGKWINGTVSGGGGGGSSVPLYETPSVGTVDGSNKVFTFTNTPLYVVADGMTYTEGNGYSRVGNTITLNSEPYLYVYSYYSSPVMPHAPSSGNVDGSNKSFTFLEVPEFIVADGVTYYEGNGYSIVGKTITLNSEPYTFVRGFYSSTRPYPPTTGTVNGTNKVFTFDYPPRSVVADGITYYEGNGYSLSGNTITLNSEPYLYVVAYI